MVWYCGVKNNLGQLKLGAIISLTCALLVTNAATYAVSTEVNVNVCGAGAQPAEVKIDEPRDDSVINSPTVTLRGTVMNTSQIEVSVDGAYTKTIAVGANQTSFETSLDVTQGTHTIRLAASATCQAADATDDVVLTYQPIDAPTNGSTTPTQIEESGVIVSDQPVGDSKSATVENGGFASIPILGAFGGVMADAFSRVGLDSTIENQPAALAIARVSVTLVSLSGIVLAGAAAPHLLHAASMVGPGKVIPPRLRFGATWAIRIASAGLFFTTFFF